MNSCIYEGTVRHRRLTPVAHQFRQALFLMYLDLEELPTLFRGRWFWSFERSNLASFRRADHFGDSTVSLDKTVRSLVESRLGRRPCGPIRLLTHLRYFGYCFNPLSVFFCYDGEQLDAVVAEVTNTPWGERHCYVLDASAARSQSVANSGDATEQTATTNLLSRKATFAFPKAFHVSPFMEMDVEYHWQLSEPGSEFSLHAENQRASVPFFDATLTLKRREITTYSLARALLCYPFMTAQVISGIYWQALRLWWKRLPYVPHPIRSASQVKST